MINKDSEERRTPAGVELEMVEVCGGTVLAKEESCNLIRLPTGTSAPRKPASLPTHHVGASRHPRAAHCHACHCVLTVSDKTSTGNSVLQHDILTSSTNIA